MAIRRPPAIKRGKSIAFHQLSAVARTVAGAGVFSFLLARFVHGSGPGASGLLGSLGNSGVHEEAQV
jgi:hypothetical protein